MKKGFLIIISFLFVQIGFGQTTYEKVNNLSSKDRLTHILDSIYSIRAMNMDTGLFYINEAIFIARDLDLKKSLSKALMQKGVITFLQGDYDLALENYQNALRIAEEIKDKNLQGQVLKELGNYANRQGEYWKAHEYSKQAKQFCEATDDLLCVATTLRTRGLAYRHVEKIDSAEMMFLASYEIKKELKDTVGLPYAYNDLASIAMYKEAYEQAAEYLRLSSEIRQRIGDKQGLAIDINNLGEMYFYQKDYPKAIENFKKSIVISKELKFTDLLRHTLNLLGESHTNTGNYQSAFENLKESTMLKDSLFSVEKTKSITEMEVKFETEKNKRLVAEKTFELKKQRLIGFAILSLLLLLAAVVYYRFYQQRKYQKQIQALTISEKLQSERARISRDLHDNVGASLTSIITKLDIISYQTNKQPADKISSSLEKVNNGARDTMQQLRETIWAIKKDSYTLEEFTKKIQTYLQNYLEEIPDLKWQIHKKGNLTFQLSPAQVLNLFRIIQEATQNTIKYAKASKLDFYFDTNNTFSLKITDNGLGFNKEKIEREGHYGLENMATRAENINASFEISTKENQGVSIEIIFK